ncbi:ATP-binding protein [Tumidithrix helvetica PCC 7403]|uniref:sensor histidine kinase n=1 Tax=Tumidithrix helvetica TaxID=3457545 RepID=UPI003C9E066A
MQEILDQIDLIQEHLDAVVVVDRAGIVRYANHAAEVLFNRRTKELIGEEFGLPIIAGERTDIDILHANGQMITAEMRIFETQKDGEVTYIIASLRDITERKRTEEWLRYQNERERLLGTIALKIQRELNLDQILAVSVEESRHLLQADRVLIYRFHPDWSGTFVVESAMNQAIAILGETIYDPCFDPDRIAKYYHGAYSSVNDVETEPISECYKQLLLGFQIRANLVVSIGFGDRLWGLLVAHQCYEPRKWQQFEIESLQKIANHVSIAIQQAESFTRIQELNRNLERQVEERTTQLENSLEELKRSLQKEKELHELKSQFVAMASHEFRTPLATIQVASDLLRHYSDRMSEEKKLTHFDKIQQEIRNMTALLEELLTIGKVESGRLAVKPQEVQLESFCKNAIEEIRFMATEQHSLEFKKLCKQETCITDANLVHKILTNLLSNAIKYSPMGGAIVLTVIQPSEQPDRLAFQVSDSGVGITLADQAHIFEPFFRARNVGKISGTGLGLAIAMASTELLGGTISVQSEVDTGTTFTFLLPVQL